MDDDEHYKVGHIGLLFQGHQINHDFQLYDVYTFI